MNEGIAKTKLSPTTKITIQPKKDAGGVSVPPASRAITLIIAMKNRAMTIISRTWIVPLATFAIPTYLLCSEDVIVLPLNRHRHRVPAAQTKGCNATMDIASLHLIKHRG